MDGYVTITVTADGVTTGGGSQALSQLDITNGLHVLIGDRECDFLNSGECSVTDLINFDSGFGIDLKLFTAAAVQLGGTRISAGDMASAFTNFYDTSAISGLTFADLNGNCSRSPIRPNLDLHTRCRKRLAEVFQSPPR